MHNQRPRSSGSRQLAAPLRSFLTTEAGSAGLCWRRPSLRSRELSIGELTDRRRVMLPAIAAGGGLVLPALLYLALNPSAPAAEGWGAMIGTDTAFMLGALTFVGPACPTQLRVFLLTLTIAVVVAVSVIGTGYRESIDTVALALAGGSLQASRCSRGSRSRAGLCMASSGRKGTSWPRVV